MDLLAELQSFETSALEAIRSAAKPEELEAARRVFLQGGFAVVDITNKPVEVSAKEILELVGH